MKTLKKISILALLLVGLFSFKRNENIKPTFKLDEINLVQKESNQKFGCRPSSEFKIVK